MNTKTERNTTNGTSRAALGRALVAGVALALAALPVATTAATTAKTTAKTSSAKKAAQKAFATPDAAFQALADAAKANDTKALTALLGSGSGERELVSSGDAVADKQGRERFAALYADKHSVKMDSDDKATLIVGNDDWPMPIPAMKGKSGWTLNTAAGSREILARRIGRNELEAMQVVRAIVDAQFDYASADRDADGIREYARKFASSPGKMDGLYWPTKEGEPPSPLGPLVVKAASQGYKKGEGTPTPYHGYYYRILTAQGKDAKGGVLNYIVQGKMIGGFAVLAYPAQYNNSGIMSFIAGADGTVYQKDLGAGTAKLANAMQTYNPDSSWKPVP